MFATSLRMALWALAGVSLLAAAEEAAPPKVPATDKGVTLTAASAKPLFEAGEALEFRLTIRNTGEQAITLHNPALAPGDALTAAVFTVEDAASKQSWRIKGAATASLFPAAAGDIPLRALKQIAVTVSTKDGTFESEKDAPARALKPGKYRFTAQVKFAGLQDDTGGKGRPKLCFIGQITSEPVEFEIAGKK